MRALLHVPVGLIAALLVYSHWAITVSFCLAFMFYEANQDSHHRDQAWKDVYGFLWGVALGGLAILIGNAIKG